MNHHFPQQQAPSCVDCPNEGCFIRKSCSMEWRLLVNERKKFMNFRKGQAIIYAGMPLNSISFIYSGKIKVIAEGLFEKQQIKRLAKAGYVIGFRGLGGDHLSPSNIYAIEDSQICSLDRDLFVTMLKANPDVMFETLLLVTEELRKSEWRMKNLTLMNVQEKIAYSLLYMDEVFGSAPGGEIDARLTRQEISEIACTSKELVSRTLSEFEREGTIKMEGKKIFLADKKALKDLIGLNEEINFA